VEPKDEEITILKKKESHWRVHFQVRAQKQKTQRVILGNTFIEVTFKSNKKDEK